MLRDSRNSPQSFGIWRFIICSEESASDSYPDLGESIHITTPCNSYDQFHYYPPILAYIFPVDQTLLLLNLIPFRYHVSYPYKMTRKIIIYDLMK